MKEVLGLFFSDDSDVFFVQKGHLAALKGAVHFAMALWVGRILPLFSVRSDHVLVL